MSSTGLIPSCCGRYTTKLVPCKWEAYTIDRKPTPALPQFDVSFDSILALYSHPPNCPPINEPDLDKWSLRSLAKARLASLLPSRPKLQRDLTVETKPAMVCNTLKVKTAGGRGTLATLTRTGMCIEQQGLSCWNVRTIIRGSSYF